MKGISSLGIKLKAKEGRRKDRIGEGCMQLKTEALSYSKHDMINFEALVFS